MTALPPDVNPSIDAIYSRNATKIYLSIALPGGKFARVGRIQSISEDIANNVQVLSELGSQFAVELKKGITTYSFSISKMYVRSDVIDALIAGAIFALQLTDDGGNGGTILEQFQQCAITSVSRTFNNGQATVAQNASVVVIGQSQGQPD